MKTFEYGNMQGGSNRSNAGRSRYFQRRLFFVLPVLTVLLSVALPARMTQGSAASAGGVKPGTWTQLGPAQGETTAALVHVANGNDLILWMAPVSASNKYFYVAAEIKPTGGTASGPKDIFGGNDWHNLDPFTPPVLVSQGGKALLIFEGNRTGSSSDKYSAGCVIGDLLTPGGWQLQSWSLSANCPTDHLGATITTSGMLSAAWPAGWANGGIGLRYRIGTSPSLPASGDDQRLSTAPGMANSVAEATDTANQDIYAVWARSNSTPVSRNGIWAADLSKNPSPLQAPGSGTNTQNSLREAVAVASPTGRGGIYLAYCNNTSPCSKVELWRYGAKSAVTVPKATSPTAVSLSAGPSGRLWIAWWSAANGTVSVVRTNEAGKRFGPVKTYAGPSGCKGDANGTIKISNGSQQRLDVAVTCFNGSTHVYATQSLVPLQLTASTGAINHQRGGSVTFRVSDVGDAVAGATVKVGTKSATTNKKGLVTFRFPKGAKTGSLKVVANAPNYLPAATSLQIN